MSQMLEQKRVSRGTRMAELVGEAADQDETFWNDGIWQEAESDEESFVAEEDKPDVFDSDFDESETEEEEDSDDEKAAKRVVPVSSSNRYKEPSKVQKAPVKRKDFPEGNGDEIRTKASKFIQSTNDEGVTRTIRKSTSAKTLSADMARNEKDEEVRAKNRPSQRRIVTKFTQEELLVESFETVDFNNKWLTTQRLIMEERAVADRPVKKVDENASFVRFHSKRGGIRTITFSSTEAMPSILTGSNDSPEIPDNVCVITGLTARYRDPKTGYPYHNLAAFKELRRRYRG